MVYVLTLEEANDLFGAVYSPKYQVASYKQEKPIIVVRQINNSCEFKLKDHDELIEFWKITNSCSPSQTIMFEFPDGTTKENIDGAIRKIRLLKR